MKKDTRIRVVNLNQNGGANVARKTGIETAKADLVGFVDSDDWDESNMYTTLINIQEKHKCDLVSSGMYRDDIRYNAQTKLLDNFKQGIYNNLPEEIYKTMLFDDKINDFGIYGTLCNKLFKKDILMSVFNDIDKRVFYEKIAWYFILI